MDINYYKEFNKDLQKFNNHMLINHYNKKGYSEKRIFNETSFYEAFPDFDYNIYQNLNNDLKNHSKFNLEKHYYFYGRFEKRISSKRELNISYPYCCNNIIIYPHLEYNEADGGINVMYYLAQLLELNGKNVRIYPSFGTPQNPHFNKYLNLSDTTFSIKNSVVIYCEGTQGNPLDAIYIIRWILSPIGLNVPRNYCLTWGNNELLYYFNNEERFDNNIKLLPIIMLDNTFINKFYNRNDKICYTYRKSHFHKNINKIHDENSYEIKRNFKNNDLIEIFNNYTYFYSYDPITFLNVLAAKCGCISVVYPIEGVSKKDWLKMSSVYWYLEETGEELYGIAYGLDDIEFAKVTLDLVEKQWNNILEYNKEKYLNSFIKDLQKYNYSNEINCMKNYSLENI